MIQRKYPCFAHPPLTQPPQTSHSLQQYTWTLIRAWHQRCMSSSKCCISNTMRFLTLGYPSRMATMLISRCLYTWHPPCHPNLREDYHITIIEKCSNPQPSLMPNVDGVLSDIAYWNHVIATDLLPTLPWNIAGLLHRSEALECKLILLRRCVYFNFHWGRFRYTPSFPNRTFL